jgi:hypothetical protein
VSRQRDTAPPPGPADWVTVGHPPDSRTGQPASLSPDGVSAIRAADPAFAADAFVAWSGSVFERSVAAWSTASPEPLRPVMAEEVWHQYAEYMLATGVVALGRKLMASARAESSLAGAGADGQRHSVLIGYAVAMTDRQATAIMPAMRARWHERWLFQRPAGSRTHPSGAVAVCLVCGGPADPRDSGNCPYCHASITTRTAGWLVTQVATTRYGARKFRPAGSVPARPGSGAPRQPAPVVAPPQPPRSS